jgi:hypothetical protein
MVDGGRLRLLILLLEFRHGMCREGAAELIDFLRASLI